MVTGYGVLRILGFWEGLAVFLFYFTFSFFVIPPRDIQV